MSDPLASLDKIPKPLVDLPIWLVWKSVANGNGKRKKVPYYANGAPRGKTDTVEDRRRLVPLHDACKAFQSQYAGLGIALGAVPGSDLLLSGIDLDGSVRDGVLGPKARAVLAASHDSYAEISPSGAGLKIFGTGDIGTEKSEFLEIYSGGRFFAVTGERIQGDDVRDLTDAAEIARQELLAYRASQRSAGHSVSEGGRNNSLFAFVCGLRARNVPKDEARRMLDARNLQCAPPLPSRELAQLLDSAWRYDAGFALTDLGNAQRLVAACDGNMRYVPQFRKFFLYDGLHWRQDDDGEAVRRVKNVVREMYNEARDTAQPDLQKRLTQWALASQNASRIAAAEALAKTEPGVPLKADALDANRMLLGVANGVVDLATGELRPPTRDDLVTTACPVPYLPGAAAPRWNAFLLQVMDGDASMVEFLQRAVGYSLTGLTVEQCLFMLVGGGANGKSTFLSILRAMLGPYAAATDAQTWMARDQRGPSNDLAALRSARFVCASETDDGARLAEVLIKQVTGGDPIKARFLYGEFFEFIAQFKLWFAANHKPVIRGDDYAMWRRIRLVPFSVTIPRELQDKTLERKLREELPGVLVWAVEGCLAWQRHGMPDPARVADATAEYRREMDHFGQFLDERCELAAGARIGATALYLAYDSWADEQGIQHKWTQQRFGRKVAERGPTRAKTAAGIEYHGIRLRSDGSAGEALALEREHAAKLGRGARR